MKRCFIVFLSVSLLVSLIGCNKSKETATSSGEKSILQYWYPWGGDSEVWDLERIQRFETEYPQYRVEAAYVPEGSGISNGKLAAAVASNDVPDLLSVDVTIEGYSYATQGYFEPMDDMLKKLGFLEGEINQAVVPIMKWKGKTYLFPQDTTTSYLYYRTDFFEEVGLDPSKPPTTIDELDVYAEKLTVYDPNGDVSRYGIIPWLDEGLDPKTWSWQFGANVYNPQTNQFDINCPEMLANWLWQISYAKKFNPAKIKSASSSFGAAFSTTHAFMTGRVAMTATGNWFSHAMENYAPEVAYNIAPLPAPASSGRYGGTPLGGAMSAIPRGADEIEGAVQFSLFSQDPVTQDWENKTWRSMGIYRDRVKEFSLWKAGDRLLPIIEATCFNENSGFFALSSSSTLMNDLLRSGLEDCIYNNSDPSVVLSRIEKQVQEQNDSILSSVQ
jgi:ABC-type glycerol-3-phosphate transport system substrate-binding protein